ncbi:MAG: formylglycine-generating enzyme family protein [Acidobacteriota bacterium]|nr:formylglycine-generating enzyme family protein [Acidobacteriota bacterium]
METFTFETVRLKPNGEVEKRFTLTARQFIEPKAPELNLKMVEIPGGSFLMGSPETEAESYDDEKPQHEVKVPPFYIGKFTITQAQWRIVAGWDKVERDLKPNPAYFKDKPDSDQRPVEKINWLDAQEFCARLSAKTGRAYRLPTEAEWEYACRAGTTTPFAFGETITPEFVNYNGEYPYGKAKKGKNRGETVPVGSLSAANSFGLFDMHGNVWEWCEDDWVGNYQDAPTDGSARKLSGGNSSRKLLRGGSCINNAGSCRAAFRYYRDASDIVHDVGLRVVVSVRKSSP